MKGSCGNRADLNVTTKENEMNEAIWTAERHVQSPPNTAYGTLSRNPPGSSSYLL